MRFFDRATAYFGLIVASYGIGHFLMSAFMGWSLGGFDG